MVENKKIVKKGQGIKKKTTGQENNKCCWFVILCLFVLKINVYYI